MPELQQLPRWLAIDKLKRIFSALDYECRIVGGCVRDIILDHPSKDIDLATPFLPKKIIELLRKSDITAIPTGIKYGTVTAIYEDLKIEITTLRRDTNCQGRDTDVIFTDQWIEDAKRRDFTINAMYMDLDGRVYDYFNSLDDIKKPIVRFIGEPEQRIEEDHLRILRFFRFCARFGIASIDAASLNACVSQKDSLDKLSGERIHVEMLRLLDNQDAQEIIALMAEHGILDKLEIKQLDITQWQKFKVHGSALLKLVMLILVSNVDLQQIRERWRLSNIEHKYITQLLNADIAHDIKSDENKQKIAIYKFGKVLYQDALQLKHNMRLLEDITHLIEFANQYKPPAFPISAQDIMDKGYTDCAIGEKLRDLETAWLDSYFSLSRDELLRSS